MKPVLDVATARHARDLALADGDARAIQAYSACPADHGDDIEYCLFLKPELMAAGSDLELALRIVTDCLPHELTVAGAIVLPGSYLRRHDLMAQHYGTINRVSRFGVKALTADVVAKTATQFGVEPDETAILGAHQFLEQHAEYSVDRLRLVHDAAGSSKVAGGTYAIAVEPGDGRRLVVLNGFHPAQLAIYYDSAAAILALALRHRGDWAELRQVITGSTDPREAAPSSIRGRMFASQAELRTPISPLLNGVHVSAGPVEGMSEITRYFTDWDNRSLVEVADTCFGRDVQAVIGQAKTALLASNPIVEYRGAVGCLFDLTEEMNPPAALDLVSAVSPQLTP